MAVIGREAAGDGRITQRQNGENRERRSEERRDMREGEDRSGGEGNSCNGVVLRQCEAHRNSESAKKMRPRHYTYYRGRGKRRYVPRTAYATRSISTMSVTVNRAVHIVPTETNVMSSSVTRHAATRHGAARNMERW